MGGAEIGGVHVSGGHSGATGRSAGPGYTARLLAAELLPGAARVAGTETPMSSRRPPDGQVARPVRREERDGYFEATGTTQTVMSVDIRARVRKGFLRSVIKGEEASVKKEGRSLL